MTRIHRHTAVFVLALAAVYGSAQGSTISEIVVNGNKNVAKEAILAAMSTKVGQPYVQETLNKDKESILGLGYFKAVDVRPSLIENNNWRVYVDVTEFDLVKEVRIVGNTVFPLADIMKVVTIKPGQPFNLRDQKPTADAIKKLYRDKGYFGLPEEIAPLEDSPGTVSIIIREMTINQITITGNSRTQDRVIKRMIKSKPGQVFNEDRWVQDLQRLFSTQWFEKINPTDESVDDGSKLNLGIELKEARTGNIVFGATVDPRNGLGGQIRLVDSNFRGTGQSIGINGSQAVNGGGGTSLDLDYSNPYMDSHETALTFSLYSHILYRFLNDSFTTNSSDRYTERRTGASLGLSRPVGDRQSASIGVRFEGIKTTELNLSNPTSFVQQDGQVFLGQFGYLSNRRDIDMDPARGTWLNFTTEPGIAHITTNGGALAGNPDAIGNMSFVRSQLEWRGYYSPQGPRTVKELDAPRRVFAVRVKYGSITGKVPFYEQFFAGGGTTVRGYQDDRFWGKQMALASVEYRHPVQKSFNVIGFLDYGGAWGGFGTVNNFDQSDKMKLHLGYGVGFSFKTPLGPIRLDFGFGEKGKSRTHFQIGTSF